MHRIVVDVRTGEQSTVPFTPEEEAEALARAAAQEWAAAREQALLDIEAEERRSLRALRELVLSLVEPGVVSAKDVATAEAKLIEAEQKIRVERAKLA